MARPARQKLTIGEWVIFIAACAMMLTMFTPGMRTWTLRDAVPVVVASTAGLLILSPWVFVVTVRPRSGLAQGPDDGTAIDGRAWAAAILRCLALGFLVARVLFEVAPLIRKWTAESS